MDIPALMMSDEDDDDDGTDSMTNEEFSAACRRHVSDALQQANVMPGLINTSSCDDDDEYESCPSPSLPDLASADQPGRYGANSDKLPKGANNNNSNSRRNEEAMPALVNSDDEELPIPHHPMPALVNSDVDDEELAHHGLPNGDLHPMPALVNSDDEDVPNVQVPNAEQISSSEDDDDDDDMEGMPEIARIMLARLFNAGLHLNGPAFGAAPYQFEPEASSSDGDAEAEAEAEGDDDSRSSSDTCSSGMCDSDLPDLAEDSGDSDVDHWSIADDTEDKPDTFLVEPSHRNCKDLRVSLLEAWEQGAYTDFIIKSVDDKQIHCHKLVLNSCPYFNALFECQMVESQNNSVTMDISNYDTINLVVKYLYSDQILLSWDNIEDVYELAAFLQCTSLQKKCEKYITANLLDNYRLHCGKYLTRANRMHWYLIADRYESRHMMKKLKDVILSSSKFMHELGEMEDSKFLECDDIRSYIKGQCTPPETSGAPVCDANLLVEDVKRWVEHKPIERTSLLEGLKNYIEEQSSLQLQSLAVSS